MEIKLTLDEQDLQLLDEALSQLPYFKVVDLINKINLQISNEVTNKEDDNPVYAESNDSDI